MSDSLAEKGHGDEHVESFEKGYLDHDETKNEQAYKGDDSDGKVLWTPRNVMAAISLGCLYTGEMLSVLVACTRTYHCNP